MAANANRRRVRSELLGSTIGELSGFLLTVDCGACQGPRTWDFRQFVQFYGADIHLSQLIRKMRCNSCKGPVTAAWLDTGPEINARAKPRRVPLIGPEAIE